MQTVRLGLAGIFAAALAAGCSPVDPFADLAPLEGEELSLLVENHNFNDATIYAVAAGRRQRLGRVPGNGERTFVFRWELNDLRVEIDFLSAGVYTTENMPVTRGDALELVIEQSLDHLTPVRRRRG